MAYIFKFSPDSIWNMDMDDLDFWDQGTNQVSKWMEQE